MSDFGTSEKWILCHKHELTKETGMSRIFTVGRRIASPALALLASASGKMSSYSPFPQMEESSTTNNISTNGNSQELEIGSGKDFSPRYPLVAEEDETEEEKQYWENKRHCSFCNIFMDSPCRQQFKSWSMCVDRCKAEADTIAEKLKKEKADEVEGIESGEEEEAGCDFASHCSESTMALFTCQAANEKYFEPYLRAEEEVKKSREAATLEENQSMYESATENRSTQEVSAIATANGKS